MSMQYIRDYYSVPAKRGMRVKFTDADGVVFHGWILSAFQSYIRVQMDELKRPLLLHPTWNIEYMKHQPKGSDDGA